jgi:MoxR-like ATPase
MMKQDVATRLNPLLDTRGHIVLTEKDSEIVHRHPCGHLIISMNPFSGEFAGTKPLNAAFRRRMSVWINFDYLSVGEKICPDEITLIQKRSGVPQDTATKIVKVGAELRRQYKNGELPYGPWQLASYYGRRNGHWHHKRRYRDSRNGSASRSRGFWKQDRLGTHGAWIFLNMCG